MPTNLIRSRPPIPFHDVNDRKIDEIVGTHTRKMWMNAGIPTARPRTSLSWRVRMEKRRRRLGAPAAFVETAIQTSSEGVSVRLRYLRGDAERVPEVLDALEERGHVLVGVRQPGLQEAMHLLGEARIGVTVEELCDRLRSTDDLGRLLLEGRIATGVRVIPGSDAVRVGDEEGDLCGTRAEVLEEGQRRVLVRRERRRLGGHHEPVDRGIDAELRVVLRAQRREGEEVQVVVVGLLGGLLAREGAEEVHAGL